MRVASLIALLFQLAWNTAVPILHAESEALSSQAAFEGAHSDDCVRLHDPAHNATCSAVGAPAFRVAHYTFRAPDRVLPFRAARVEPQAISAGRFSLHLARSPPIVL